MRPKIIIITTCAVLSLTLMLRLRSLVGNGKFTKVENVGDNIINTGRSINQSISLSRNCYRLHFFGESFTIEEYDQVKLVCRKHFPRAFIVGATGCGTAKLMTLLAVHPDVACPSKDTNFFSTNYYKDMAWYFNHMPHATDAQLTIEKSSGYLTYPGTAARIARALGSNVKIVVLLCDEVSRAINDYYDTNRTSRRLMKELQVNQFDGELTLKQADDKVKAQTAWQEYARRNPSQYLRKKTFASTVLNKDGNIITDSLYIDTGIYVNHMRQWLLEFPRRNILVLTSGEDILKDPVRVMQRVEHFLGLSSYFSNDNFDFDNSSGLNCLANPVHVRMESNSRGRPLALDESIREKLLQFYRPYNTELQRLLFNTSVQ